MTKDDLHTNRTSARQVCKLENFPENTVKGWGRRDFKLAGSDKPNAKLETGRGRHNLLSVHSAVELALTIHFYRNGIELGLAHEAAIELAHSGHPLGGWIDAYGGTMIDTDSLIRLPSESYFNDNILTIARFTTASAKNPSYSIDAFIADTPMDYSLFAGTDEEDCSDRAAVVFDIGSYIDRFRERLGVPIHTAELLTQIPAKAGQK